MEIFLVNSNGLRSLKLLRIPIHFYSVWSIKMAYLSNFDQHDIVMDSFKIPEPTLVNGGWDQCLEKTVIYGFHHILSQIHLVMLNQDIHINIKKYY